MDNLKEFNLSENKDLLSNEGKLYYIECRAIAKSNEDFKFLIYPIISGKLDTSFLKYLFFTDLTGPFIEYEFNYKTYFLNNFNKPVTEFTVVDLRALSSFVSLKDFYYSKSLNTNSFIQYLETIQDFSKKYRVYYKELPLNNAKIK